MSGKIKARNITSQVVGPTFDHNDPAKFPNKGKYTGKTMSGKTVIPQATGPTFTKNDPAVKLPHASGSGKGKSMGQHPEKSFLPNQRKPVNVANDPVVTTPPYPLKKDYRK
jgi:hypothetical protein